MLSCVGLVQEQQEEIARVAAHATKTITHFKGWAEHVLRAKDLRSLAASGFAQNDSQQAALQAGAPEDRHVSLVAHLRALIACS